MTPEREIALVWYRNSVAFHGVVETVVQLLELKQLDVRQVHAIPKIAHEIWQERRLRQYAREEPPTSEPKPTAESHAG